MTYPAQPVVVCLALLAAGGDRPPGGALELSEALELARAHAPEGPLQAERVLQAELQVQRAWALLKPTLNAQVTYTKIAPEPDLRTPDFGRLVSLCEDADLATIEACFRAIGEEFRNPSGSLDFVGADTFVVRGTLNWNIFNGRAFPAIASARRGVLVEQHRKATEARLLELSVARAFFTAVATKQARSSAEAVRARAQSRVDLERTRESAGEGASTRRELAELTAAQAELDVSRSRVAHQVALSALAQAVGVAQVVEVAVPPPLAVPRAEEAALLASAERRPDVLAAELLIEIAELGKDETLWRFVPTLALFGSYRWSNITGLSNQNQEWAGGLSLSWLLYDGGLRYADLQEADSRVRAARLQRTRLLGNTRGELERARLRLEQAELGLERAERTVELAERRHALVETQLAAGTARTFDLDEASDELREAEQALIRARLDRDLATLELGYAAGLPMDQLN